METAKRTPGEWKVIDEPIRSDSKIVRPHIIAEGECIATIHPRSVENVPNYEMDENARFICKAVNAHAALVEALKFYANTENWKYGHGCTTSKAKIDGGKLAKSALALAKGE